MGIATWALPLGTPHPPRPGESFVGRVLLNYAAYLFYSLRDSWLAFAYIGAVLLLVARNAAWLGRLAPFAATGRMALTNYMIQLMVLDLVFTPHGLGVGVTPWLAPVCAASLFAAEALVSTWWLRWFRYGPLEWVWRSATYGRCQPMRLATAHDAESQ